MLCFYVNIFLSLEKIPHVLSFPSLVAGSVTSEFWSISTFSIDWKLFLKWEKRTVKLLTVFMGISKTLIQNGSRWYYLGLGTKYSRMN